jgi:hypothetical protein
MDEGQWEKWGLLAGVVFVVLIVVAALIGGSPPKPSDSVLKIAKFYKDNQDSLKVGSYLSGLATIPLLWWLGSLFGRLRRAEGGAGRVAGIALTGGVVAAGIAGVANGINAYGALHPDQSPSAFLISTIMLGYVSFALAVLVAGTAVVGMRSKILPSWFVWASEALALAWLVAGAAVSSEKDAWNTIGFIVFLVWAVWVVVLSIWLYVKPAGATA